MPQINQSTTSLPQNYLSLESLHQQNTCETGGSHSGEYEEIGM